MFYNTFVSLCEEKGVSPSRLLGELGISKGGLSRWREGTEPTNPIKKKIADYFGITVAELMSGEMKIKKPAANKGDELSDDEKQFLNLIRQLSPKERKIVEQLATSLYNTQ